MKGWNPFGKIDMEIGSFLKTSVFNKEYTYDNVASKEEVSDNKKNDDNPQPASLNNPNQSYQKK